MNANVVWKRGKSKINREIASEEFFEKEKQTLHCGGAQGNAG